MFKVTIGVNDHNWWQRADRKQYPADLDIPFQVKGLAEVFDNMCRDWCVVEFDNYNTDDKTVDIKIRYHDPEREMEVLLSQDWSTRG